MIKTSIIFMQIAEIELLHDNLKSFKYISKNVVVWMYNVFAVIFHDKP